MTTEGTYPYAIGGVSSWCHVLIGGLPATDWEVLPLIAGGRHMQPRLTLPPNGRLLRPIELWSEDRAPRRAAPRQSGESGSLPTQQQRLRPLLGL
jgi:polysaccharide biosynthesis protein PelF